ncbi:hypothetical protein A8709_31380 [Paenibacillus pectinilyticus]|uniref:Uncharacterized protein n=1 Tax=Paenibacillus pectinilyticus TaxID=512399 RepID=A0A1C0ZW42_9BACL|nr:Ger(x)C family spore germination protein [Paenibacillus pectinilyticus]OCT12334.1 hypothetical protein A8709_31380 [Paenibacillus pectinilyticus]
MRKSTFLILLCLLTGCSVQQQIDKVGMTDTVAIDAAYDSKGNPSETEMSVAASIPKAGGLQGRTVEIVQTTASSPKEARAIFTRKSDKALVIGQLRCLLIGKELAKQGIFRLLDSYRRDSAVGERLKIVIVSGNSVDLLTKKYPQHGLIGTKINLMLEQQFKTHEAPNITLYSFVRDYYDDSVDPVVPLIMIKKDDVEMDGIALMKKDRYVGKIPSDQAVFFEMLHKNADNGTIHIDFIEHSTGKKESALISAIDSKRMVQVLSANEDDEHLKINILVKLDGIILEYSGMKTFSEKEERLALNEDLSKAIQTQLEAIIRLVQRTGADNLGIGTYVQNQVSYGKWKSLHWDDIYPHANIQVNVETQIRDYGMIR